MIYTKIIIEDKEHILCHREDGTVYAFINEDGVDVPERKEYLKWIAAGNQIQ